MSAPTDPALHMGHSRQAPRTLRERGAVYFGRGNTASMEVIALGRHRVAFASPTRLWVYEEEPNPSGFVINLSDGMRSNLIAALGGRDA